MLKKALLLTATMGLSTTVLADDWKFGIGTGFFGLNIDGDIGVRNIEVPVDLSSSDVSDLMESAFGFAGFAKNGKWTINYGLAHLELEDKLQAEAAEAKLTFTADSLYVNAAYQLNGGLSTYFGVRNTTHEIKLKATSNVSSVDEKQETDWTDAYIGLAYAKQIGKATMWTTKADIGGGGSDGSATFNTGVAWQFSQNWVASLYGNYYTVDFKEGSKGDADYYMYDASEFGVGAGILFTW